MHTITGVYELCSWCNRAFLVLYPSTNSIPDFLGLQVCDVCLRRIWILRIRTKIVGVEVRVMQNREFNLLSADGFGLVAISVGRKLATCVEGGKTAFIICIKIRRCL
jgi:hypothetical protein